MIQSDEIDLSGQQPFAQGGQSSIFRHPEFLGQVIKVNRKEFKPSIWKRLRPHHRLYGPLRESFVEYEHYLRILRRRGNCPPYIARFYGFCNTNLGIGRLSERVSDATGETSITLRKAIQTERVTIDEAKVLIDRFLAEIYADKAVFRDPNLSNLCMPIDEGGQATRLVAVDGLGEFTLVSLPSNFDFAYSRWHAKIGEKITKAAALLVQKRS